MPPGPSTRPTRQFTLRYLLLCTAIVAFCLLPVAHWGVLGLLPSAMLAGICILSLHRRYILAGAGGLFACVVIWGVLLAPVPGPRRAAPRMACANKIKQITMAILNYELEHGHLPPPHTTDSQGKPLHSWRVLILPYLEEQQLYDAIDFSKPWYHPANLALASRMPPIYRCPSLTPDPDIADITTAYVAILGDHTAWPRSGQRRSSDLIDGRSETLAILESETYRLHWMSTADPGIEMIGPMNADGETLLSCGPHKDGTNCTFLDASVSFLSSDCDLDHLRAWITIDDTAGLEDTGFDRLLDPSD